MADFVIGAKPRAGAASGGLAAAANEVWKVWDDGTAWNTEPVAQIVPESDAELPAGLGEPEKSVAAIAAVAGGEIPRKNGASSLLDCAKVGLQQATCWRRLPAVGFDHQGWRLGSPL